MFKAQMELEPVERLHGQLPCSAAGILLAGADSDLHLVHPVTNLSFACTLDQLLPALEQNSPQCWPQRKPRLFCRNVRQGGLVQETEERIALKVWSRSSANGFFGVIVIGKFSSGENLSSCPEKNSGKIWNRESDSKVN
jgi:hypothetical protein